MILRRTSGRSRPQVVETQTHSYPRSRSPTLIGERSRAPTEPITVRVHPPSRPATSAYERSRSPSPSRRVPRSQAEYTDREEPDVAREPGRRLVLRTPRSRSTSPEIPESVALPVRPPSRIRTQPGPPTVITIPGTRSRPSSPTPHVVQIPSSPRRARERDRRRTPSDGKFDKILRAKILIFSFL